MAVIKQQRQAFASNIGVVRADTGAAEMWRGVGKLADTIIEGSFQQMKVEAQQTGEELGRTTKLGSLRSINPETGEVESSLISSLAAPDSFGSVARQAYKSVIETRYVKQIEEDFKFKAAELALEYKDNPNAVALFSDDMADFIEQSTKLTAPQFQQVVKDMGSSLLASNKINLMETAMLKDKENLSVDFQNTFTSDQSDLLKMFSNNDPIMQSDAGQNQTRMLANIEDNRLAGIITSEEAQRYRQSLFETRADGAVARIANLVDASDEYSAVDLNNVRDVIQRNGGGLTDLPEEMQAIVSEIIDMEVVNEFSGDEPVDVQRVFSQIQTHVETSLSAAQARVSAKESAEAASQTETQKTQKIKDKDIKAQNEAGLEPMRTAFERDAVGFIAANDFQSAFATFDEFDKTINSLSKSKIGDKGITEELINSTTRIARQRMLTAMIDKSTSGLNSADTENFMDYVNTSGDQGKLTGDFKTAADGIIKAMDLGIDRKELTRHGGMIAAARRRGEQKNAEATKTQKANIRISTGRGSSTNTADSTVLDKVVTGGDEAFFLKPEAVAQRNIWGRTVMSSGVLPLSLQQLMIGSFEGKMYTPQQQQNLFVLYDQFSRVPSTDGSGSVVNMWHNSKLTAEQNGFFEAMTSIVKFRGYEDLPQVMDDVRGMYQNKEALKIKTASMFPDGLNNFMIEATTDGPMLGSDIPNPNIVNDMKPYIEYLIAGNAGKEDIVKLTRGFYKQLYPETKGMVIDPAFGTVNRSRQALSAIFPNADDQQEVVSYLNASLRNKFAIDDKFFSLDSGGIKDGESFNAYQKRISSSNRLRLMPLTGAGQVTDNTRYMVVEQRVDGSYAPLMAAVRPSAPPIAGQPASVPVVQQVLFDVAEMRKAVPEAEGEPLDPAKLAERIREQESGRTEFKPTIGGGFAGQLLDVFKAF
ncbi:MAG: hypothetical protein CMJ25_13210 [Phycisphaerae bacterium]|nr:hypothetical protein [Phycisphaerae bacterium]